ncbi:hypothetical protein ABE073_04805 [Lederbergia citrisecunda]|uniref:hypothetical protein n=1 Tax=Lederbergia citrisecunda TaxID=2833583 RepID=UPI003D282359
MIKISENYAIDFDPRNFILQEKFEKREGKGKHAPLSGEIGYRDVSYHSSFESLVDKAVETDLKITPSEEKVLRDMVDEIKKLKAEIVEVLSSNIQIDKG